MLLLKRILLTKISLKSYYINNANKDSSLLLFKVKDKSRLKNNK